MAQKLQNFIKNIEYLLSLQEDKQKFEPEKFMLSSNLRKFVNDLLGLNLHIICSIPSNEIVWARKTINEFGYNEKMIMTSYMKLYIAAQKKNFANNEIHNLFRSLLIKAYLSQKTSFELYKNVIKTSVTICNR